jgi:hypothetical protein
VQATSIRQAVVVSQTDPEHLADLRTDLAHVAEEASLAARLADVETHLGNWEGGDEQAGVLAADALDQLAGLLPDLISTLQRLHLSIPLALSELPSFPE